MPWSRIFWVLLAIAILLLTIAPLASYCLGREQDYDDKAGRAAPVHVSQPSVAIAGPLIVPLAH